MKQTNQKVQEEQIVGWKLKSLRKGLQLHASKNLLYCICKTLKTDLQTEL